MTRVNESYTSKCDALALEPVMKHDSYSGKRVKRGMFISANGRIINADVNGALNIGRKVFGDTAYHQLAGRGFTLNPVKITPSSGYHHKLSVY